jgi:hypothetical protein
LRASRIDKRAFLFAALDRMRDFVPGTIAACMHRQHRHRAHIRWELYVVLDVLTRNGTVATHTRQFVTFTSKYFIVSRLRQLARMNACLDELSDSALVLHESAALGREYLERRGLNSH